MKDRWFHWLMEKTRARRTSNARDESDNKKTAVNIMGSITDLLKWFSYINLFIF
jgi:hypothetical protein